jgi:Amt family ammonium transporter
MIIVTVHGFLLVLDCLSPLYRGFIGDPRPFVISRSRYEYRLEFSANYSIYAVLLYFKPICDNYTSTDGALLKGFVFSPLLFMVLFIIFVYAPLCHMTWHPEGVFFLKWGSGFCQELLYT